MRGSKQRVGIDKRLLITSVGRRRGGEREGWYQGSRPWCGVQLCRPSGVNLRTGDFLDSSLVVFSCEDFTKML